MKPYFWAWILPFIRTPPYINITSTPLGLLSFHFLLHMTTLSSSRRTTLIVTCKLYMEYKTEAKHIVAEAKVNHGTQYYRITLLKILLPSNRICTDLEWPLKELIKFYESCSHWISSTLSKFLVRGGGAGERGSTPPLPFILWNCVQAIVLSRLYQPQGGCRILMEHGIRNFIVSTVAIVCKPFREERVTKTPNKLENCAWFLKWF